MNKPDSRKVDEERSLLSESDLSQVSGGIEEVVVGGTTYCCNAPSDYGGCPKNPQRSAESACSDIFHCNYLTWS